MDNKIGIVTTQKYYYPKNSPFRPSKKYVEYPFSEISKTENHVYEMVRETFHLMGYDKNNFNLPNWNPLKDIVKAGDNVVLKPNLVMDKNGSGEGTDCLFTNPSVVAAVIDYVVIALKGKGKIIVGDAPMQSCDFEKLINDSGYSKMIDYYKKVLPETISIELVDFRDLVSVEKNGVLKSHEKQDSQSIVVDLGEESSFYGESKEYFDKIRITNYDPALLKQHHNEKTNEYLICKDILNADVIINIPKPKTHRKAGVTISLKNMIGVNSRKEYLPHHANGAVIEGGDEFLKKSKLKNLRNKILDKRNYLQQTKKAYVRVKFLNFYLKIINFLLNKFNKEVIGEGNWLGNDTISRTITDINKIIFYADKFGAMQNEKQRKYLIVADMIISGEKDGPLRPSPKNVGMIAVGENPVYFDEIIARIMGAKLDKINTFLRVRETENSKYSLCEKGVEGFIVSLDKRFNNKTLQELKDDSIFYFKPQGSGWVDAFLKQKK